MKQTQYWLYTKGFILSFVSICPPKALSSHLSPSVHQRLYPLIWLHLSTKGFKLLFDSGCTSKALNFCLTPAVHQRLYVFVWLRLSIKGLKTLVWLRLSINGFKLLFDCGVKLLFDSKSKLQLVPWYMIVGTPQLITLRYSPLITQQAQKSLFR
jgi:hypothetical protein